MSDVRDNNQKVEISLKINKRFFNDVYLPYIYSSNLGQDRIMVYYGGAGSGKSKWVVQCALLKGMSMKRKFLVCRKVGAYLRESIYSEFVEALKQFGIYELCKVRDSLLKIWLPNGTEYIFKGLEDPERIKSIEGVSDIIMEEATEFTLEDFNQLNLRLRNKKVPNNQIVLMYNPVSKLNWVYPMFHDPAQARPKNCRVIHTTYEDNKFLPQESIDAMLDMKNSDPVYYEVYALGKFATLGKLVFNNWRVEKMDHIKLIQELGWKPHFGLDYGFTADSTALISVVSDVPNKRLYVFDEWYSKPYSNSNKMNENISIINTDIFNKLVDKKLVRQKIWADSSEQKSNEELRRLGARGVKGVKKGKDSVIHGLQFMKGYEIIISPNCPNLKTEFENYGWKKDKATGEYLNVPIDKYSHGIDALRYALHDLIPRNTIQTIDRRKLGL